MWLPGLTGDELYAALHSFKKRRLMGRSMLVLITIREETWLSVFVDDCVICRRRHCDCINKRQAMCSLSSPSANVSVAEPNVEGSEAIYSCMFFIRKTRRLLKCCLDTVVEASLEYIGYVCSILYRSLRLSASCHRPIYGPIHGTYVWPRQCT